MELTAQASFIRLYLFAYYRADIDSYVLCADINECSNASLNNCHKYANCINEIGNYSCVCKTGFVGDGVNCTGTHCTIFSKQVEYCSRLSCMLMFNSLRTIVYLTTT